VRKAQVVQHVLLGMLGNLWKNDKACTLADTLEAWLNMVWNIPFKKGPLRCWATDLKMLHVNEPQRIQWLWRGEILRICSIPTACPAVNRHGSRWSKPQLPRIDLNALQIVVSVFVKSCEGAIGHSFFT
jgi:hypothetical protein